MRATVRAPRLVVRMQRSAPCAVQHTGRVASVTTRYYLAPADGLLDHDPTSHETVSAHDLVGPTEVVLFGAVAPVPSMVQVLTADAALRWSTRLIGTGPAHTRWLALPGHVTPPVPGTPIPSGAVPITALRQARSAKTYEGSSGVLRPTAVGVGPIVLVLAGRSDVVGDRLITTILDETLVEATLQLL